MNNVNRKEALKFTSVEFLHLMKLLKRLVQNEPSTANLQVKEVLKLGEDFRKKTQI